MTYWLTEPMKSSFMGPLLWLPMTTAAARSSDAFWQTTWPTLLESVSDCRAQKGKWQGQVVWEELGVSKHSP